MCSQKVKTTTVFALLFIVINLSSKWCYADNSIIETAIANAGLEPNDSYYLDIKKELATVNLKGLADYQSYAEALLKNEFDKMIQNHSSSVQKFLELYRVGNKLKKDQPDKYEKIFNQLESRYEKYYSINIETALKVKRMGLSYKLDESKLDKNIYKNNILTTLHEFQEAFLKAQPSQAGWIREKYSIWIKKILSPVEKPKEFREFFFAVVNVGKSNLGSNELAYQIEKLYQFREQQKSLSKFQQFKNWLQRKSLKKVDEMIDFVQSHVKMLPTKEQLYLTLAIRSPTQRNCIFNYLYRPLEELQKHFDYAACSLDPKDFTLNETPKNEISKLFVEYLNHFEEYPTGRIGPMVFAKLIQENPSLAEKLSADFYANEFLPSFFGDALDPTLKGYVEYSKSYSPLKNNIQIILKYMQKNAPESLLIRIRNFLTNEHFISLNIFNDKSNYFEDLLPFINLNTFEGSRFAFRHLSFRAEIKPYQETLTRYFNSLSDNRALFLMEITRNNQFKTKLIEFIRQGYLNTLYHDDPKSFMKFVETWAGLSEDIIPFINEGRLPLEDIAESYVVLMKKYFQFSPLDQDHTKTIINEFEKIIQVAKNQTPDPYWRRVIRIGDEFKFWLQKPSKINIEQPILEVALPSRLINLKNISCDQILKGLQ